MKRAILTAFSGLILLLSGCATLFSSQPQAVPVSSQPAGAEVFVNGELMGRTPVTLTLDARQGYEVTLRLGGEEKIVILKSEVDNLYVALDVLPAVGLGGASLAFVASCSGNEMGCLGFEFIGLAVGLGGGLLTTAVATVTDATTGAWYFLTPDEVIVVFD